MLDLLITVTVLAVAGIIGAIVWAVLAQMGIPKNDD